ncbi:MAG: hypothetical protein IKO61_01915 [Lachnospiraceae bacterium]|nr:hypothetical protein [Lachnospiraceae bacterium]
MKNANISKMGEKRIRRTMWDNTFQRRLLIMEYISFKRVFSYRDIEEEFGIGAGTVKSDLDSLETDFFVPLYRVPRKKIRVIGEWRAERPKIPYSICVELAKLRTYLPDDKVMVIKSVLDKYGYIKALDEVGK